MKKLKWLPLGACLCFLSGCVATFTGSRFNPSQVEKIQGGKTTKPEVESLLGYPDKITQKLDGTLVWTYQDMKSTGCMMAIPFPFLPNPLLQVGEGEQEGDMLTVIMRNDVVMDYELTFIRGSYFGHNRNRPIEPKYKINSPDKEGEETPESSSMAGQSSAAADPASLKQYRVDCQETQYLVFLSDGLAKEVKPGEDPLDAGIKNLVQKVGTRGKNKRRLAFMVGIPTWQNPLKETPVQRAEYIADAAIRNDVAVYFMVPTLGGWEFRPDMWNYSDPGKPGYAAGNYKNVEWSGWNKEAYPHRYRDWGQPEEMPPLMCYNSPAVLGEVDRIIREQVAPAIKAAMARFKKAGKEDLFAGLTVGDEQDLPDYSMVDRVNPRMARFMEQKGAKKARLGYNALSRMGYRAAKPPKDFAAELARINQGYLEHWTRCLNEQGVPKEKMYTHIAAAAGCPGDKNAEFTNAPIGIAFNGFSRPGWTTYADQCLQKDFSPLYQLLEQHKQKSWASTEANPFLGGDMDVREFLYRHFAFGAVVVVLNTGATSEELSQDLNQGVWGGESLKAFRDFLNGEELKHHPEPVTRKNAFDPYKETRERVQNKVKEVQAGIQRWHAKGLDPSPAGRMMQEEFEPLIRQNDIVAAEKKVDEVLEFLKKE